MKQVNLISSVILASVVSSMPGKCDSTAEEKRET